MMRSHGRAVIAGLAALACFRHLARSQEQTLKIVYPYAAGGSGDAIARMMAEQLQKDLGRPVIVENKTGAGGRIGAQAVKDADPTARHSCSARQRCSHCSRMCYENLGYDPVADFAPSAASSNSIRRSSSAVRFRRIR